MTPAAGVGEGAVSPDESADISPQSDPDVALMLRVRHDEPGAFEAFVDRYKHRVLGILYRAFGRREDIEDMAQEVFLRVYRARHRYEPTAKFSTWLYTIANNVALNAKRTRARRPTVPLVQGDTGQAGEGLAVSQEPRPDSGLEREELAQAVQMAIDRLPPQQRIAVVLNKFEGFSYQDIAETLDMTVAAVRSLLSRARGNLRDALQPVLNHLR